MTDFTKRVNFLDTTAAPLQLPNTGGGDFLSPGVASSIGQAVKDLPNTVRTKEDVLKILQKYLHAGGLGRSDVISIVEDVAPGFDTDTHVSTSAMGSQVVSDTDDINFSTGFIVSDDGDNTITVQIDPDLFMSMEFLGVWDASTNAPTITSSTHVGNNGDFYVVTVAGTTSIDGNSDWQVGDVIIWNEVLGVWQEIGSNPHAAADVSFDPAACAHISSTNVQGAVDELCDAVSVSNQSIRVHAESTQIFTAGGAVNVVAYDTVDHDVGGMSFDNAGDFINIAGAGVYHITAQLRMGTPPVGVISNATMLLQVDEGSIGSWVTVAESVTSGVLSTNTAFTLACSTSWQVPDGTDVRVVVTYSSTLGGVLQGIFPGSSSPINFLGVDRIA